MKDLVVSVSPGLDWALLGWLRQMAEAGVQLTLISPKRPLLPWLAQLGIVWLPATRAESEIELEGWNVIYFASLPAAVQFFSLFQRAGGTVVQADHWSMQVAPFLPEQAVFLADVTAVFEQAIAVHTVTQTLKQQAVALGLSEEKAVVIPPGVNLDFFQSKEVVLLQAPFRLITAVSLKWNNGLEYLLQSTKHLVEMGIPLQLEIIGHGRGKQQLRYLINSLQLTDHVQQMNHLSRQELCQRFQTAHLYFQPSLIDEPDPCALEAMACGLPLLSVDGPNWQEWLGNGQEEWLVSARQPAEFAALAARLLQAEPETYQSMREAARDLVTTRFSLGKSTVALTALFHRVGQTKTKSPVKQASSASPSAKTTEKLTGWAGGWMAHLKAGLWRQRMNWLPGTIIPRQAGVPDPNLPDLAVATIAVGALYVRWALALIETVRRNGRFQGPIYLLTDQPNQFQGLPNVISVTVPSTRRAMTAKQYKTWLPFFSTSPYTLFLDADVMVGRPLQQWVETVKNEQVNYPLCMFWDGGFFHEPYHTGVILYNKALAKSVLERWRRAMQSGRYNRDQSAFLTIVSPDDVFIMPAEHFIFPVIETFKRGQTTTFNHITVTDLQRSFAPGVISHYLKLLHVKQLPF
ncbi:MAG: glycosyltransferase family 4 protein [Chloroflexi bacterium]|nr:glycosyltransferase family 4 protein [Chloroflexota bacterium]